MMDGFGVDIHIPAFWSGYILGALVAGVISPFIRAAWKDLTK
jgi:hypothetical protein